MSSVGAHILSGRLEHISHVSNMSSAIKVLKTWANYSVFFIYIHIPIYLDINVYKDSMLFCYFKMTTACGHFTLWTPVYVCAYMLWGQQRESHMQPLTYLIQWKLFGWCNYNVSFHLEQLLLKICYALSLMNKWNAISLFELLLQREGIFQWYLIVWICISGALNVLEQDTLDWCY